MEEIKKGENYLYSKIETFASNNNYNINEYGNNRIGENFLTLKHNDKDIVISFVLDGATANGYIYKCIYSDK